MRLAGKIKQYISIMQFSCYDMNTAIQPRKILICIKPCQIWQDILHPVVLMLLKMYLFVMSFIIIIITFISQLDKK